MVNIVPQIYIQHVIYEKERPILYVTLNKALYGCRILASLLYEHLVADMRGKGFEINPYYPFMANKMIGGNKIIVCWHVDELKVSHVEPKEVTNSMDWIEVSYRYLIIIRFKVH